MRGHKKDTPAQDEVLHLLTGEGLTPRQIVSHLKISPSRVYRIIRKLKDKGLLEGSMMSAWRRGESLAEEGGSQGPYRLHAEHWRMQLSKVSQRYRRMRKEKRKWRIESNTILLHREAIEIRSHVAFFGASQEEGEERSYKYWPTFFKRLSERLGASWSDVERVGAHYAYMDSEIARRPEYRRQGLAVKDVKTGKVWLITDGSLGKEDETIGRRSGQNRRVLDHYLNDLKDNEPPTNSELHTDIRLMMGELVPAIENLAENMNTHVDVMQGIKEGIRAFNKTVKNFRPNQRLLNEWPKKRRKKRQLMTSRSPDQQIIETTARENAALEVLKDGNN